LRELLSGCVIGAAAILAAACGRQPPAAPAAPTQLQIWQTIEEHAGRYRMEPTFVYALVAAESNFDASAANGDARGLLQLKPSAWAAVRKTPYEPNVWDWRENLRAGIDYLALCRQTLHAKQKFSYPRLLAAFHYGLGALEAAD
jgi:soluble lytic murein transglycosylase-like protein